MTAAQEVLAAILVFVNAATSDFLEARYVQAVNDKNADRASAYSMLMWLVGVIGIAAFLKVGWWVLGPEAAGLCVGTRFAMRA